MPIPKPIQVLVVDDSAFMRRAIRTMIDQAAGLTVVDTASNGVEAVQKAEKLQPDVVTLDIEMPQMDGLTALRQIKRCCKAAVLMVSSLTTEGSVASLTALRNGAADFIAKDFSQVSLEVVNIEKELIAKVRGIAGSTTKTHAVGAVAAAQPELKLRSSNFDVITIGSSTGGPPVLETIIGALPAQMVQPIVIAQHMPKVFTQAMAERLDSVCALKVLHAENGMPLAPNHVYIAPGGQQTLVKRYGTGRGRIEVNDNNEGQLYKPSVDLLFSSAAQAFGSRTLAIVLTGMGEDGLIGARDLQPKNATILAQNAESCVVYGMPKAVTQAGLIAASLNPQQIAGQLQALGTGRTAA